jgi:hypothetical protein
MLTGLPRFLPLTRNRFSNNELSTHYKDSVRIFSANLQIGTISSSIYTLLKMETTETLLETP